MSADVFIPISSPGHLLSVYRSKSQLSQAELAKLIDVSAQSMHNYENGKQEPSASTWSKLVDVLKIPNREALAIWR